MKVRRVRLIGLLTLTTAAIALTGCATEPTAAENGSAETTADTTGEQAQSDTRVVVDLAGREVTIPAQITSAAILAPVAREPVVMLGATDQVVASASESDYWNSQVDPAFADIEHIENGTDPNVEQLIELGVQVVFFRDNYPDITDKLEEAGIAVLQVAIDDDHRIQTAADYLEVKQQEILFYGEVFGGEALEEAQRWSDYAQETVDEIYSQTESLSEAERPRVYYVRGPEALTTHGGESQTRYIVDIAGGYMVSEVDDQVKYDTTMEQVVNWNPEYIFMGRVDNVELVTEDPAWASIQAVQQGNVFVNLRAVGAPDYASSCLLLMQQTATTLHPDLFSDVDMVEEVQDYFSEFYEYELTEEQAVQVLTFDAPQ